MNVDPWSLAAAFGGGVLGAAVGALPAFILCGAAVVAGSVVTALTGDTVILYTVAWGPLLGPHVAFAGGVAAAAYAGRRHDSFAGRDVLTPLLGLKDARVLVAGGLFGLGGQVLFLLLWLIPDPGGSEVLNRMALVVVLSGIAARLAFGSTGLFGRPAPGRRWDPGDEGAYLPWHARPGVVLLLGLGGGWAGAWLALALPGAPFLGFGIASLVLLPLLAGRPAPVLIHIVLAAGLTALASGSVLLGTAMGVLAAWLGEAAACLLLIPGDTHLDPPATALLLIWPLIALLPAVPGAGSPGGSGGSAIVAIALLVAASGGGHLLLTSLRRVGSPAAAAPAGGRNGRGDTGPDWSDR